MARSSQRLKVLVKLIACWKISTIPNYHQEINHPILAQVTEGGEILNTIFKQYP